MAERSYSPSPLDKMSKRTRLLEAADEKKINEWRHRQGRKSSDQDTDATQLRRSRPSYRETWFNPSHSRSEHTGGHGWFNSSHSSGRSEHTGGQHPVSVERQVKHHGKNKQIHSRSHGHHVKMQPRTDERYSYRDWTPRAKSKSKGLTRLGDEGQISHGRCEIFKQRSSKRRDDDAVRRNGSRNDEKLRRAQTTDLEKNEKKKEKKTEKIRRFSRLKNSRDEGGESECSSNDTSPQQSPPEAVSDSDSDENVTHQTEAGIAPTTVTSPTQSAADDVTTARTQTPFQTSPRRDVDPHSLFASAGYSSNERSPISFGDTAIRVCPDLPLVTVELEDLRDVVPSFLEALEQNNESLPTEIWDATPTAEHSTGMTPPSFSQLPCNLLKLLKESIMCCSSDCEKTFNRTVICQDYLIKWNRPIQCACGCVMCSVCYTEQEGCREHNLQSARGAVNTTASRIASCPYLENVGEWDLQLETADHYMSDAQVNDEVHSTIRDQAHLDENTLFYLFQHLMITQDRMSFKYRPNEAIPRVVAYKYVCIPHVPEFWYHVLVGTRPPPDTEKMFSPDVYLPKLFDVALHDYRFHWCCFVLKEQVILAMWCTSSSANEQPRMLTLVDGALRQVTGSIEFKRMVYYLSQWFSVQYVLPRGRKLKVVLDCKPSEGPTLVHFLASVASKCGMKKETNLPIRSRIRNDRTYTLNTNHAKALILHLPPEDTEVDYINIVSDFETYTASCCFGDGAQMQFYTGLDVL